jgi:hypothetical protein
MYLDYVRVYSARDHVMTFLDHSVARGEPT